jgi:hypothetical protein
VLKISLRCSQENADARNIAELTFGTCSSMVVLTHLSALASKAASIFPSADSFLSTAVDSGFREDSERIRLAKFVASDPVKIDPAANGINFASFPPRFLCMKR